MALNAGDAGCTTGLALRICSAILGVTAGTDAFGVGIPAAPVVISGGVT